MKMPALHKRNVLLLVFFLLLFGLFYLLKGNILNLFVKPWLEQRLSKTLGLTVEMRRLNFSLGTLHVSDLTVKTPEFEYRLNHISLPLVKAIQQPRQVKFFINGIPFTFKSAAPEKPDRYTIHSNNVDLAKLFRFPFKISGKGSWNTDIRLQNGAPEWISRVDFQDVWAGPLFLGRMTGAAEGNRNGISAKLEFKNPPQQTKGSFSASLKQKGGQYTGKGLLSLEEFFIKNEKFSRLLLPFTLSQNRLRFPRVDLQKKRGHPYIEGSSFTIERGIARKGELNLILEGDLNNELLALIVPTFEKSGGKAKVSCHIGGSTQNPLFFGSYILSDGLLKTSWFPHTFEQLNANIAFSKNKILVHKLSGEAGGGKVVMTGDILLKDFSVPQFDIRAELSDVTIQYPKGLSSRLSGVLYLKGIKRPYELTGNLLLSKALYKENIDWESEILKFKRKPYLPKTREPKKPALKFNVSIRGTKNIFIKNNLADLEANADLFLRGGSDLILLIGKMELISGTAFFKDNLFKLTSAKVIFDNPVEIDPKFSILSETAVQEYKIFLGIEGTLSKYTIRLSSQPPLPESDIVSLLTFGALRSEIEKQESLDVTSLELGSLFFGGVQKAVEAEARKRLGLKFRLSPSYSDTKHATVPRLLIGKTIAKNLDATFSSTFDKSAVFSEKEFNLKYNLHKNLSLLGFLEDPSEEELQDNASYGVDFKVQFEFR